MNEGHKSGNNHIDTDCYCGVFPLVGICDKDCVVDAEGTPCTDYTTEEPEV